MLGCTGAYRLILPYVVADLLNHEDGAVWSFFYKKRRARKKALEKAGRLLMMQLLGLDSSERFVDEASDRWPLGYCFGMLQASLEAAEPTAKLAQADYRSHISSGFGAVFDDEAFGVIQFRVSVASMGDAQFQDGCAAGIAEYVELFNSGRNQAHVLSHYLIAVGLKGGELV